MNRLEIASAIKRSADWLEKFIRINAPELVIENERQIMFKRMITFPVNEKAQDEAQSIALEIINEEDEWLNKTGYYRNITGENNDN